jgi:hypothetical protein
MLGKLAYTTCTQPRSGDFDEEECQFYLFHSIGPDNCITSLPLEHSRIPSRLHRLLHNVQTCRGSPEHVRAQGGTGTSRRSAISPRTYRPCTQTPCGVGFEQCARLSVLEKSRNGEFSNLLCGQDKNCEWGNALGHFESSCIRHTVNCINLVSRIHGQPLTFSCSGAMTHAAGFDKKRISVLP